MGRRVKESVDSWCSEWVDKELGTGVPRICIHQNEHRHRRRKSLFVNHRMTDKDTSLRTLNCLLLPHNHTLSSKVSVSGHKSGPAIVSKLFTKANQWSFKRRFLPNEHVLFV